MSDTFDLTPDEAPEFTPAEQWAMHSAVLDYVERALETDDGTGPVVEFVLLEKIESSEYRFTPFEYGRLRDILADYAASDETPDIDRDAASTVVGRIDRLCPGKVRH
jgi:hypothetical protein